MSGKRMIEPVKDNMEKQITYREQLTKYKKALEHEFYFEAMLIVYAMIEDRMRSFLFHIGAMKDFNAPNLNEPKTKKILRRLYYGSEEEAAGKRIDINKLSGKEQLIRETLHFAMNFEGTPEEEYLSVLKQEFNGCLDIGGFLDTLDQIDEWSKYRNEIIHGLLNKNLDSLNLVLRERVEDGMKYARFLDSQVKALKKKEKIRKSLKMK